jgi:hypothetical protein
MSEAPEKQPQPQAGDHFGRILFLIAGGLLLAAMVSCSCNPVR